MGKTRKQRKSRNEIMQDIYVRLLNPRYSYKMCRILEMLQEDPKAKIITSHLVADEGWVMVDYIEKGRECPYGSPEKHRYQYLKDELQLIEKKKFRYFVRKPGQKNRCLYTEAVYRLKRTKRAFLELDAMLGHLDAWVLSEYRRVMETKGLDDKTKAERSTIYAAESVLITIAHKFRTIEQGIKKPPSLGTQKILIKESYKNLAQIRKSLKKWENELDQIAENGTQDETASAGI